jgi:hypothetical protein
MDRDDRKIGELEYDNRKVGQLAQSHKYRIINMKPADRKVGE